MTAVAVGCSALFGEFCPWVPHACMAPYTGDTVPGLNPILDQISALGRPGNPRYKDSQADGRRDGRVVITGGSMANLNQANFGEARYSRCSQCQPKSPVRRSDSGSAALSPTPRSALVAQRMNLSPDIAIGPSMTVER